MKKNGESSKTVPFYYRDEFYLVSQGSGALSHHYIYDQGGRWWADGNNYEIMSKYCEGMNCAYRAGIQVGKLVGKK